MPAARGTDRFQIAYYDFDLRVSAMQYDDGLFSVLICKHLSRAFTHLMFHWVAFFSLICGCCLFIQDTNPLLSNIMLPFPPTLHKQKVQRNAYVCTYVIVYLSKHITSFHLGSSKD